MNEVEYPSGSRERIANPLFVGSNPTSTSQSANHLVHGSIAQLAEQTALNRMVAGSTPATPIQYRRLHRPCGAVVCKIVLFWLQVQILPDPFDFGFWI